MPTQISQIRIVMGNAVNSTRPSRSAATCALNADQGRSHNVTARWLIRGRIARFGVPDECTVRGGRAVQMVQLRSV